MLVPPSNGRQGDQQRPRPRLGGVGARLILFIALALPGVGSAQNLRIRNQARLPAKAVQQAERAIRTYANGPLRMHWHTPRIAWRRAHAWAIYLRRVPGQVGGAHYYGNYTPPTFAPPGTGVRAVVFVSSDPREPWRTLLGHEVLEMLVDPRLDRTVLDPAAGLQLVEVCDPVQHDWLRVRGVRMPDFVFPSWYHRDSAGPWDLLHLTHAESRHG